MPPDAKPQFEDMCSYLYLRLQHVDVDGQHSEKYNPHTLGAQRKRYRAVTCGPTNARAGHWADKQDNYTVPRTCAQTPREARMPPHRYHPGTPPAPRSRPPEAHRLTHKTRVSVSSRAAISIRARNEGVEAEKHTLFTQTRQIM